MTNGSHRPVAVAAGGLVAMAAAIGIGRFVYTPILPFMEQSLGLSKAQAGLIASGNYLGYLLGALAASAAWLPGGLRRWFLVALAVSALTTGAMGLVSSLPALLALRFAAGIASAYVLVLAAVLILNRLETAGRPALSALHFAGVGSGIVVSAVVVALLGAAHQSWRMQWLACGAVAVCAWTGAAWLVPREESGGAREAPRGRRPVSRGMAVLIVAYGLFGFGYVITATFISVMVRTAPEIRSVEPFVWLTVGLAAIPSVALWTWIGRRAGNHVGFALACTVESGGVAMSVLAHDRMAVVLAAALLGGTFMGITALGLIHARELAGEAVRRSLALLTAAFGLGQMIAPAFAGYVYELRGSFVLPSLVAAAALLLAGALALIRPRAARSCRD